MAVIYEKFCELILALPAVEEGTSYGTPGFKVKGKLIVRLKEDGETIVLRIDYALRSSLMEGKPDTFFITDHYAAHPWMLISLKRVSAKDLAFLLENAWKLSAPNKLVKAHEEAKTKN
jgi:hypothetical protein